MKFSWSEPGIVISAAAHAAVLIALLVGLSSAKKFDDAQESVPVETVTNAEFNQIMKGEKTAKEKALQPHPRVEKVAAAEVEKPRPPTPDAKNDVQAPPPPLKHVADPGTGEPPETVKPSPPVAVVPPPRPQEAKQEPPQPKPPAPARTEPEAKKPLPPPRPDAEVIENAVKPAPKQQAQTPSPPLPPVKAHPEKREEPKPKVDDKILNQQVAKILKEKHLEEIAAADVKPPKPLIKATSKPKSGDEQAKTTRRPDFDAIRQLISHEDPQSTGSTGRQLNKVASLGAETANSQNMDPSLEGELEGVLVDQYKQCWTPLGLTSGTIMAIDVNYRADGSLAQDPLLLSHPTDPALRQLAESALAAVRRCNPLRIPPKYQALFAQEWTGWHRLRFNPADMMN